MLRHPALTRPERTALETALINLRRSVVLIQMVLTELERR